MIPAKGLDDTEGEALVQERADEAAKWLEAADLTYCSARLVFVQHNPFLWFDAAYLLHQALEKYAKALLAHQGRGRRGHSLSALFRQIMEILPEIDVPEVRRVIEKLDHLQELRYPDMRFSGPGLGPEELDDADFVVRLVRERLPKEVTDKGIGSLVRRPLENFHLQLVAMLVKDNEQLEYWKEELLGISAEVNAILGELPSPSAE